MKTTKSWAAKGLQIACFMAVVGLLASCSQVDSNADPAPRRTPPTAKFIAGAGFISTNTTVASGSTFKIGYLVVKGSSNLTQLRYSSNKTPGTSGNWFDENISFANSAGNLQSSYTDTSTYSLNGRGSLNFKVYAIDQNSLADSSIITVSVQ